MAKQERKDEAKQVAITQLLKIIKPGDTLQTILRHCSRSGMSREISVTYNGQDLDWLVATILDMRIGKHGGLVIKGCGMDMGFAIINNLGYNCYPNGTKKPHGYRNGKPDTSGGYAFKQSWL